jgi:hypothetical protein
VADGESIFRLTGDTRADLVFLASLMALLLLRVRNRNCSNAEEME